MHMYQLGNAQQMAATIAYEASHMNIYFRVQYFSDSCTREQVSDLLYKLCYISFDTFAVQYSVLHFSILSEI